MTRSTFLVKMNENNHYDQASLEIKNGEKVQDVLWDQGQANHFLLAVDNAEFTLEVQENVKKTLEYSRSTYDTVLLSQIKSFNKDYEGVIIVAESLESLSDLDVLIDYVYSGGNVFIPYRLETDSYSQQIFRKLGIIEYQTFTDTSGVVLEDNLLIGARGIFVDEEGKLPNSSLVVQLSNDVKVSMRSTESIPLLWERAYGTGKFVYFNGTMLGSKENRSVILGGLAKLVEDFTYPILNSKVVYIDDFPAPFPFGSHEKISKEFNRSIVDFYKEIWWPDMLEISKRYNFLYTAVAIGTYDDKTMDVSPSGIVVDSDDFLFYGRDVIKNSGELGVHGYNHQPLTESPYFDTNIGYNLWPDKRSMEASLKILQTYMNHIFPNYTLTVYVPPSNILDESGREAVKDAGLKIIGSLYLVNQGEDGYAQEFEIADDGMIELPRISHGYATSPSETWDILNGISLHGTFSHFVHPDDILDYERSGDVGWESMFKSFDDLNEYVYKNFKWLDPHTASESSFELLKLESAQIKYIKEDFSLRILVDNYLGQMSMILRTEKEIEFTKGCDYEQVDENIYLLKLKSNDAQVVFKGE